MDSEAGALFVNQTILNHKIGKRIEKYFVYVTQYNPLQMLNRNDP
jgi:hypothetical protein